MAKAFSAQIRPALCITHNSPPLVVNLLQLWTLDCRKEGRNLGELARALLLILGLSGGRESEREPGRHSQSDVRTRLLLCFDWSHTFPIIFLSSMPQKHSIFSAWSHMQCIIHLDVQRYIAFNRMEHVYCISDSLEYIKQSDRVSIEKNSIASVQSYNVF